MTPNEWHRRCDQVTVLGYRWPNTETQECLEVEHLVSPEEGVDDDLHEEDPRVDEAHSRWRLDDLTDYLLSIPGLEVYNTALKNAVCEDADWGELESDADSEVDVDSVEAVLDDQVEDDSVQTIPDDHIEVWFDDQIEVLIRTLITTTMMRTLITNSSSRKPLATMGCLERRMMGTLTTAMMRTLITTALMRTFITTVMMRTLITNRSSRTPLASILRYPFRRYILHFRYLRFFIH